MSLGEKNASRGHVCFYAVFITLLAAYAVLTWMPRVYPMVDIPFKLASCEIIRYMSDPGNRFAEYYAVDWSLKPNILYTLFCSWSVFPSVEFANRVFLALYVLSMAEILVSLFIRLIQ